jgi:hypothetical protein
MEVADMGTEERFIAQWPSDVFLRTPSRMQAS